MAKKRTRVLLPGGIQSLVHDLQNGESRYAPVVLEEKDNAAENAPQDGQMVGGQQDTTAKDAVSQQPSTAAKNGGQSGNGASASEKANCGQASDAAVQKEGRGEAPKEYHIVKDDSKDSWELFLDMAKQYKTGGGKLATIYIDSTLKNVLDRMKYAGPEKLSTSAILSSIVARFIYDHEEDIRKVLFSGKLI